MEDATVVANDTAGGLLLLSLATGHPALGRIGRLVLTNCESYDQFPPDELKKAAALCRALPRLSRALSAAAPAAPAQGRRHGHRDRAGPPSARNRSSGPPGVIRGSPTTSSRPWPASARNCSSTPPAAIPRFDRPVLLVWGDSCGFFPMAHAQRLASDFPHATLVPVPGAKTWVPVDNPAAVADAIVDFVPTPVP